MSQPANQAAAWRDALANAERRAAVAAADARIATRLQDRLRAEARRTAALFQASIARKALRRLAAEVPW